MDSQVVTLLKSPGPSHSLNEREIQAEQNQCCTND